MDLICPICNREIMFDDEHIPICPINNFQKVLDISREV